MSWNNIIPASLLLGSTLVLGAAKPPIHFEVGQCIYYTEADPADPRVIRKIVSIHADHFETHANVNGRWYTEKNMTTSVSFDVLPWMRSVTCPQ